MSGYLLVLCVVLLILAVLNLAGLTRTGDPPIWLGIGFPLLIAIDLRKPSWHSRVAVIAAVLGVTIGFNTERLRLPDIATPIAFMVTVAVISALELQSWRNAGSGLSIRWLSTAVAAIVLLSALVWFLPEILNALLDAFGAD